ncbi:unnamed protein product [Cladocopium goreaui]|uniref:Uncharacterized protein n=1 Tax=Cladocopium goreaui TaxID=2562237 RepID=A0A9P1CSC4_9DINO|nr:unnamed protein product [Cladocopium goreaui]
MSALRRWLLLAALLASPCAWSTPSPGLRPRQSALARRASEQAEKAASRIDSQGISLFRPGSAFAAICIAYMAGIVATELIVFDFGMPKAAYHFYSASLPSLVAFPQCLRIVCPMAGVTAGIGSEALRLFPLGLRKSGKLRNVLRAAGLLLLPGLLSFVTAIGAVRAFLREWSSFPWGSRSRGLHHLEEVRLWHVVMLLTFLVCIWLLRRAENRQE